MQDVILAVIGCGVLAAVLWALYMAGVEMGRTLARRELEDEDELPVLWAGRDFPMEHEHGGEE